MIAGDYLSAQVDDMAGILLAALDDTTAEEALEICTAGLLEALRNLHVYYLGSRGPTVLATRLRSCASDLG